MIAFNRTQLTDQLAFLFVMKAVIPYLQLMRWHQPIGILLLLPPTLWALVIAAQGLPSIHLLAIFILGTVIMRSAGCVVNDLWDRDLDGKVERTRNRPLARGQLSPSQALVLLAILILLALALLLLLNRLVLLLAPIGLAGAIFYPLAKRFIPIPQLVLGLVFSWGVPMAYAAQAGNLPLVVWFLYALNFLWILAYDTQYALCDKKEDMVLGIHSSALYFGDRAPLVIVCCQAILLCGLLLLGIVLSLSVGYYIMLGLGGGLFVFHWFQTKRYQDPVVCFASFRGNHWFGWLVLSGLVLGFDIPV